MVKKEGEIPRILFLSDHLSIHTIRWAKSIASRNIEVMIFSLSDGNDDNYKNYSNISVIKAKYASDILQSDNFIKKARYLFSINQLKKLIREFKPDIVHAHYATSYGLLGALTRFHPFIISVWGSDVYDFPNNFIKRKLLRFNLQKADKVLSTSHVMARETNKYVSGQIEVTPFGIDTDKFKPMETELLFPKDSFVIGTIKSLEQKYGVAYLIRAFKMLKEKFDVLPLKLLIVGTGSREQELKELTRSLSIEEHTIFAGKISHNRVPEYLNMLDIYVAVSTLDSESFGVAILEASSCEVPVVVSRVGGLPEVVEEGKTGLIVNRKDVQDTFEALSKLITDSDLRVKMSKAGRERVKERYDWGICVDVMMNIYEKLADNIKTRIN